MNIRNLSFLLSFFVLSVTSLGAEELRLAPRAVVELFTSQGCSSCPPADKLLAELGARPDIIALAYHVDYWDYIGWPDTFGSPESSNLQRSYASVQKKGRIYTPQMMINGTSDVVGSRRGDVDEILSDAHLSVPIGLETNDGYLKIDINGDADFDEAVVWLVTFKDGAEVKIQRGENRGRMLAYTDIVINRQVLGMWEPGKGANIKLPLDEVLRGVSNGAAILVQEDVKGLPGRILGAASFTR